MITDLPTTQYLEKIIRNGVAEEIDKIIEEEIVTAQKRVASRIQDMKQGAIGRILAKFRVTEIPNPEGWAYTLKFEV